MRFLPGPKARGSSQDHAEIETVSRCPDVPEGADDLASTNFVAESITEDVDEFSALCTTFIRSVRPGGFLVAAFMENMPCRVTG
jgi:hypothetical protein